VCGYAGYTSKPEMLSSWVNPGGCILLMASGNLTILFATALVFGQLQCAAWCTFSTCDFTELNRATSQNVPPCHRHHNDSSPQSPAAPCAHGVVIAGSADFSAAQAAVGCPLAAIHSIQPEVNPTLLASSSDSAVLIASPPASGDSSPIVLRV
jgi:hypothetical protein